MTFMKKTGLVILFLCISASIYSQGKKAVFALPRDIEVIAFVNSYNPNDRCDCTVFNAGRYLLKSDPAVASVIPLEDDGCKTPVLKEYYDMSGVRQSATVNRGVYLQRIRYSDGTEKIVKVLK